MKAYVLKEIGKLELDTVSSPEDDCSGIVGTDSRPSVAEDECVVVRVHAAGICGSDIPRIYKTGAYHHPLIPGHEFSGEVVHTGSRVPAGIAGKRVGIYPLIPCMQCAPCKKGMYEMCKNYNYLGSRCDGGFAQYVKVPCKNVIELPDEVTYEQAAMLEPLSVALHAIKECGLDLQPGDAGKDITITVCGLGTIGILTVMLLGCFGYRNILCIGNKQFQKRKILELGIAENNYADSKKEDAAAFIMDKTEGLGTDVFFECVGRNECVTLGLRTLSARGRLQLVGNPASDMLLSKDDYWKILRNQLRITGTWNSAFTGKTDDDWHIVLDLIAKKIIDPSKLITHRFDMDSLGKGFEMMRDRSEEFIKVMCLM
ncbi:MAG: galactitol-1-phosphate 5-dehydrogenase [Lachnospiraceae bacterium]|nr:galactitol-1-phosphate 5-dehydrogenase [Lachnospiraceae bacterium]